MNAWLLFAAFYIGPTFSFPTGPPIGESVCKNLLPSSAAPHTLQNGNGTYDIKTTTPLSSTSGYFSYTAGDEYNSKFKSQHL